MAAKKTHNETPKSKRTPLGDFISERIKAERLSTRIVADRAAAAGLAISPSYVNTLANGHFVRPPSMERLQALAIGLGVGYATLETLAFDSVRVTRTSHIDDPVQILVAEARDELSKADYEELAVVVKAILDAKRRR